MAVRTTIAPHHAWKMIVIIIVSLVLGLWGVYDYVWKIPIRELAHERGAVSAAVRDALQPGAPREDLERAREVVAAEVDALGSALADVEPPESEDAAALLARQLADHIGSLDETHDVYWYRAVAAYAEAVALEPLPSGTTLFDERLYAFDIAESAVQAVATIPRPAAHDRPMQWLFILCLPFVPWMLWSLYATSRRVYRLDDDGTLHMPEGAWSLEDIADIDMSKWMRKSIAWVVHRDGRRVKLDDYKHRNLHRIIGAIASRLYPELWDMEAKPVKKDAGENVDSEGGNSASDVVASGDEAGAETDLESADQPRS